MAVEAGAPGDVPPARAGAARAQPGRAGRAGGGAAAPRRSARAPAPPTPPARSAPAAALFSPKIHTPLTISILPSLLTHPAPYPPQKLTR